MASILVPKSPRKLKLSKVAVSVGKRVFSPNHAYRAFHLHRQRRRVHRAQDDKQLELYSKIIGEYLHLGYFDNPDTPPEEISLAEIRRAQVRYAERILEHVSDRTRPVLDVGCGMGGLLRELSHRGFQATGITPDNNQVAFIRTNPAVSVIHSRFEDAPSSELGHRFGTIITAESLQYLDRTTLFEKITEALAPSGTWIICDYLDKVESKSNRPSWEYIRSHLQHHRFRLIHEKDFTPHILPTVRFLEHLGQHLAMPLFDYAVAKLNSREPGVSYLLEEALFDFRAVLKSNLFIVDCEQFAQNKRYGLLVVRLD